MRILISGANGFLGTALIPFLEQKGHTVVRLVRGVKSNRDIFWDPRNHTLDPGKLGNLDLVIHLAGANIAGKRWSESYKQEIWDSRIKATELLTAGLLASGTPPKIFLSMSGVGYYGSCGERILDETSPCGDDFMARLAISWERASTPLSKAGVRVAWLRTSMVLSSTGGALAKMLPSFKLGLGGRLSHGHQYWSWITLADFLSAVAFIIEHDQLSGAINMTSPNPVNNREFTATLSKAVHRPAFVPVPAILLRTIFGDMADSVFFASQRVMPAKLFSAGFSFSAPTLSDAFRTL